MQSFRRILVGVDLSHGDRFAASELNPPTEEAIRRATWLAGQVSGEITFFAALELSPQVEELLKQHTAGDERTVDDDARAVLEELAARSSRDGVRADSKLVHGRAWEEIIREAVRGKHDLVIVGTRNLGRVSRALFGSTGMKLLRYCPVPVWVTRPDPDWSDLRVLVATDFSEVSQRALDIAVRMGQLADIKLSVLHALEPSLDTRVLRRSLTPEELDDQRRATRAQAERALSEQLARTDYRTLKFGVQPQVIEGPAEIVILDFIDREKIDLVAMGTIGRTGLQGLFVGNTAERLLSQIPCSILAVKPDGFQCPVAL
ncbi:MAG TPA: universal stress protein [Planctomycetaceae bacterium]|nr:universal stress protein [Planctomycetaceae bacterium]